MSFTRWMDKLWHLRTTDYSPAIKRDKLLIHSMTWMNLAGIMLSERSRSQKAMYHMIPLTRHSGKGKMWDGEEIRGCWALGVEGGSENKGPAWGEFWKLSSMLIMVGVKGTHHTCANIHKTERPRVYPHVHTHKLYTLIENLTELKIFLLQQSPAPTPNVFITMFPKSVNNTSIHPVALLPFPKLHGAAEHSVYLLQFYPQCLDYSRCSINTCYLNINIKVLGKKKMQNH